jgi:hypothetical protein
MRPYKPYISQSLSELWDLLGSMMLQSPKFIDESGYFPGMNIDTTFIELNGSIDFLRPKIGEANYAVMVELSKKMRAHFEADPQNETGETLMGRDCLLAMEEIIKSLRRKRTPDSLDQIAPTQFQDRGN